MTTVLLTDEARPRCVITAPGRLRTRAWTRLHLSRVDRALASGVSPDSDAALSLRAHALVGASVRRALARSIGFLLEDARRPPHPLGSGVPICRRKILEASEALIGIAERLSSHEPLDARGVAMLRLLLTDGTGPVYHRPTADDLWPALEAVAAALDPAV